MTSPNNQNNQGDQTQRMRLTPEEIDKLTEDFDELNRFDDDLLTVDERASFLAKLYSDDEKCSELSDMFDLGFLSLPEDDDLQESPAPAKTVVAQAPVVGSTLRWSENPRVLRRLLALSTSVCILCVLGSLLTIGRGPEGEDVAMAPVSNDKPLTTISVPTPDANSETDAETHTEFVSLSPERQTSDAGSKTEGEKQTELVSLSPERQTSDAGSKTEGEKQTEHVSLDPSAPEFNDKTDDGKVTRTSSEPQTSRPMYWGRPSGSGRAGRSLHGTPTRGTPPTPFSPPLSLKSGGRLPAPPPVKSAPSADAPSPDKTTDASSEHSEPSAPPAAPTPNLTEIVENISGQDDATDDAPNLEKVVELLRSGRVFEARLAWDRLPRSLKDGFEGKTCQGILLYFEGKRDEAEKTLREALEMKPGDPVAKKNLEFVVAPDEKSDKPEQSDDSEP